jgi:hypothetical protein
MLVGGGGGGGGGGTLFFYTTHLLTVLSFAVKFARGSVAHKMTF